MMTDDMALLREYARHNSEEAFTPLVTQTIHKLKGQSALASALY